MQVSEVPQGFGLIILWSFYLRMYDSSASTSLDPHCVLKRSHLLKILVCKSVFFGCPFLSQLITVIVPQVSRVPTQSQGNYSGNKRPKTSGN